MPENAMTKAETAGMRRPIAAGSDNGAPRILACVNMSPASAAVVPHASAIAAALDGNLALVHVVEPNESSTPSDPVAWDIRQREADLYVAEMARRFGTASHVIATQVLQGRLADKIREYTAGRIGDITALCRNGSDAQDRIGDTARRVMEASSGSLLLVPVTLSQEAPVRYRRIMVPLDGSTRAEGALPIAIRLAAGHTAEILLVHAAHKFEFIQGGAPDVQDIEMQERLSRHVLRSAKEYLSRMEESLLGCGVPVATVLLEEGHVSRRLAEAVTAHDVDLLVMSSHGQSGYSDVPVGHVSNFILSNINIPVVMVRRPSSLGSRQVYSDVQSKGTRQPDKGLK